MALHGCTESQVLSSSQSSSWLTALTGGQTQTLHSAHSGSACQPCYVGPPNPVITQPSTFPDRLGTVGMNHALNVASLLTGKLLTCMDSLLSHDSAPFLKKKKKITLCSTHTAGLSHCPALYTLRYPKVKNSFSVMVGHSLLVPWTVSGARISLLEFPSQC